MPPDKTRTCVTPRHEGSASKKPASPKKTLSGLDWESQLSFPLVGGWFGGVPGWFPMYPQEPEVQSTANPPIEEFLVQHCRHPAAFRRKQQHHPQAAVSGSPPRTKRFRLLGFLHARDHLLQQCLARLSTPVARLQGNGKAEIHTWLPESVLTVAQVEGPKAHAKRGVLGVPRNLNRSSRNELPEWKK